MDFYALMQNVVFANLKKIIRGITMIRISGLSGTWFQEPDSPISFCVTESVNGEFILKVSITNVYVPTEIHIFEDPIELVDFIQSKLSEWRDIPVVGRTWSKAEDYERTYGTLTGVDFTKEFGIEPDTEQVFDDAVTEIPDREIALV